MLPCACSSNWKDYTEPGDRILVLVDVYIPEMGKEAVTTGKKCQIEYVYASVSQFVICAARAFGNWDVSRTAVEESTKLDIRGNEAWWWQPAALNWNGL